MPLLLWRCGCPAQDKKQRGINECFRNVSSRISTGTASGSGQPKGSIPPYSVLQDSLPVPRVQRWSKTLRGKMNPHCTWPPPYWSPHIAAVHWTWLHGWPDNPSPMCGEAPNSLTHGSCRCLLQGCTHSRLEGCIFVRGTVCHGCGIISASAAPRGVPKTCPGPCRVACSGKRRWGQRGGYVDGGGRPAGRATTATAHATQGSPLPLHVHAMQLSVRVHVLEAHGGPTHSTPVRASPTDALMLCEAPEPVAVVRGGLAGRHAVVAEPAGQHAHGAFVSLVLHCRLCVATDDQVDSCG